MRAERLSDDGSRIVHGHAALKPVRLDVALVGEEPVISKTGESMWSVESQTKMLMRHSCSISFRCCYYRNESKYHQALTEVRLAALLDHPLEDDPSLDFGFDRFEFQPDPAPPPMVGGRTTTAPPSPVARRALLEALTV